MRMTHPWLCDDDAGQGGSGPGVTNCLLNTINDGSWIAAPVTRQCHPDSVQVELIQAKMPPTMKIIIKTGIEISVQPRTK